MDEVALVHRELHVVDALIDDLVRLGLDVAGQHDLAGPIGAVRLDHRLAHHERAPAVGVALLEQHRAGQQQVRTQRVEDHVLAGRFVLDQVHVDPDDRELVDVVRGIARVGAVSLADHAGRVPLLVRGADHRVVILDPLGRRAVSSWLHPCLDVADPHRDQPDEIG